MLVRFVDTGSSAQAGSAKPGLQSTHNRDYNRRITGTTIDAIRVGWGGPGRAGVGRGAGAGRGGRAGAGAGAGWAGARARARAGARARGRGRAFQPRSGAAPGSGPDAIIKKPGL